MVKLVKMIQERDLSDRVKTKELPVKALCAASYASLVAEELDARVKVRSIHWFPYDPVRVVNAVS